MLKVVDWSYSFIKACIGKPNYSILSFYFYFLFLKFSFILMVAHNEL